MIGCCGFFEYNNKVGNSVIILTCPFTSLYVENHKIYAEIVEGIKGSSTILLC